MQIDGIGQSDLGKARFGALILEDSMNKVIGDGHIKVRLVKMFESVVIPYKNFLFPFPMDDEPTSVGPVNLLFLFFFPLTFSSLLVFFTVIFMIGKAASLQVQRSSILEQGPVE